MKLAVRVKSVSFGWCLSFSELKKFTVKR